jgi:mono/diheme cytochrome c family protein
VKAGFSPERLARTLALMVPAILFLGLAGCSSSEEYSEDLTYPMRADLIVDKAPEALPVNPDPPGQLDESIALLSTLKGATTYDPAKLPLAQRQQLNKALEDLFGRPAKPKVAMPQEVDDSLQGGVAAAEAAVQELKLDEPTLAAGSKLYRRHCLHCHGVAGDGRGPTGPWVNPHPRDYRQGLFKFISAASKLRPRREDLIRTLRHGIESTSMPAFNLLKEEELEQLASYVIHLSLRGNLEYFTLKTLLSTGESGLKNEDLGYHVNYWFFTYLKQWKEAQKVFTPPEYPYKDGDQAALEASITRGFQLFSQNQTDIPLPDGTKAKGAGCIGCHWDYGRQVPFRYDAWGTLVRPANLTAGVYRGGRRPIDLYWRIMVGIDPAAMPASKPEDLKPEQAWDLVNFLQALPYPRMLPEKVRQKIYDVAPTSHQMAER